MTDTVLTTEQTEKLKEIELELFKCFIEICTQLNIKYYVMGGTMLGSVRHQGFIPWDDDIDVALRREDYELFCEKAQEMLPENIFLQTVETDPEYISGFAKLRDSNTTFVETSIKERNVNHGVYIDIFPLDYYPEKKIKQCIFYFKQKAIKVRLRKEYTLDKRAQGGIIKNMVMNILFVFSLLMYPTVKSACRAREALFTSVSSSSLLANLNGAWGKKEIVPAEWYGNGCMLKFENIEVCAPIQYEKWLKQVYGDYMQLPPVEKRVTHHYTERIDLEHSFRDTWIKQ